MRILLIHNLYKTQKRAGAEIIVEEFVRELVKEHEIVVVTTGTKFSMFNFQCSIEDGAQVIRFAPWNIFPLSELDRQPFWKRIIWRAIDWWNPQSYFAMKKILRKTQPDVVWSHTVTGMGYLSFLAIRRWQRRKLSIINYQLSSLKGVRWIFTPHNSEYIFQYGHAMHPLTIRFIERFTMFFTRWFTSGPDIMLAPSVFMEQTYSKYGFWKNAIKPHTWPAVVEKVVPPPPLPEGCTFLYLGQLEEQKGIDALVRAFQTYANKNIRLLIAGFGSLENWIREQTAKDPRIEYVGPVQREDIPGLFARSSVLIVPSRICDTMPTVIREAFAFGRPVIGSNWGGIPEIVKGKGILLESLEEKEFYRAFDEIQKKEHYQKFQQAIAAWHPTNVGECLEHIGLK